MSVTFCLIITISYIYYLLNSEHNEKYTIWLDSGESHHFFNTVIVSWCWILFNVIGGVLFLLIQMITFIVELL